jgi:hypothetical protein
MRNRKSILILVLILALAGGAWYYGWNFFQANEKIRGYFIEKFRPVLSEKFNIEKLHISLGAVHLKGVHIEQDRFLLQIDDIRIGYRLQSLIVHGFKPESIANDISLNNPRLYLKAQQFQNPPPADSLPIFDYPKIESHRQEFEFIKRITISHGAIYLQDSLTHEILLASDINGFINSANLEMANAQAEGKLFSGATQNINLIARLNLLTGQLHQLALELVDFQLSETPRFFLPEKLTFHAGLANGKIQLSKLGAESWRGKIQITDAALKWQYPSGEIDSIFVDAEIVDSNLIIQQSVQLFEKSFVKVSGSIHNLFSPEFDLVVDSEQIDIRHLLKLFFAKSLVPVSGPARISFSIKGTLKNPQIQGELASENIQIEQLKKSSLKLPFLYQNRILTFKPVKGKISQNPIETSGKIDFTVDPPLIDFKLKANGNLTSYLKQMNATGIKRGDFSLSLTIGGNLPQPEMHGEFDAILLTQQDQPVRFQHTIKYQSNKFTVRSNSTQWARLKLDGEILQFFDKPVFKIKIENVQTLLSRLYPQYPTGMSELATDVTLQGNLQQADIYAEVMRRDNSRLLILLSSFSRQDSTDRLSGELIVNPELPQRLLSKFQFTKTANQLEMNRFQIDDFLEASARIQTRETEAPIEAKIKIKDAPLAAFFGVVFPGLYHRIQGWLWGEIHLDGTLQNPHFNGFLAISQGIFNKIGTYDSEVSFNFENNVFFLREFFIRQDKKTITSARGFFNNRTKEINFYLNSRSFKPHELLQMAGLRRDFLEGTGCFDVRLTRTLDNPKISGMIQVTGGKIQKVSFDTLTWKLGQSPSSINQAKHSEFNSVPGDSGLWINGSLFRKNRDFSLGLTGHVPFSELREMQISVAGNGNFLAILPELDDYFKATRSQGVLNLEIRGRPGTPRVTKGVLKLTDGYLKLSSVFDQIKNINCQVELEPEKRFLHLKELSGQIGKELLKITNVEYAHLSGREPLQPFFVSDWGLNFGILQIETSPRGVPLNIPGLMENGELGWFQVQGMNPEESAYFAGPWRRPVVRAKAVLRNLNFTYPFLDVAIDSTSKAVQVLERIEWDLQVMSAQDTRYVRKILSAPDAVYVNLLLNEGGKGIKFQGAVNDASLCLDGLVESNRGYVDYLDFNFRIEHVGARFDRSSIFPFVFGKARTAIVDSVGFTYNLWLTLYMIDPITGEKALMGRWDEPNLYLELTTDNVNLGATDGQILASLGYSAKNLKEKAPDILGISADNLLFKPIFRPFERTMERLLGLDFVQFRSRITRNWLEKNLTKREEDISNYWLLKNSRVILGKYVTHRWFLLYTGELESPIGYQPALPSIGLKHTFGLEYQIKPNLLLEMEYDYNSLLLKNKDDTRIMLRHSFPF